MTIKQQGGIFGRNPTFNNVDVEGNLNVEGSFSINGEVLSGLDFEGAWNASTNSPDLTAIAPTTGQFWIVDTAGSTNLDGITNWGVGDWALYDGSAWKRIEGGADGNFVNLTATGTVTVPADSISGNAIDGGTPTPAALVIQSATSPIQLNDAAGVRRWLIQRDTDNLFFYRYNTGGGYAGNPIQISNLNGNVSLENSIVLKNAGQGIDFSATSDAAGMTSELFDDYEEGTYTPQINFGGGTVAQTYSLQTGVYTKVGRLVSVQASMIFTNKGTSTGTAFITLPFAVSTAITPASFQFVNVSHTGFMQGFAATGGTEIQLQTNNDAGSTGNIANTNFINSSRVFMSITYIT